MLRIITLDDLERDRLSTPIYANGHFNTEKNILRSIPSRYFKNKKNTNVVKLKEWGIATCSWCTIKYAGTVRLNTFQLNRFLGLVV